VLPEQNAQYVGVKRPMKLSVGRRVVAVALDEGLDLEIQAAELLAESCGNDIRQCINALQMWAAQDATYEAASGHPVTAR
jgi:DNA polymerase III delta prime subunit